MVSHRLDRAAALAAVILLAACATPARVAYSPDELRQELARRAPTLGAAALVPYDVPAAARARAIAAVAAATSDSGRVTSLVAAMFEPAPTGYGLHYAEADTVGAAAALERGYGNCLDLASIFIGLARAVGLQAEYMDASFYAHETKELDGGLTIRSGHVTAAVQAGNDRVGLDFARLGPIRSYRVMDDLEAVAHFLNNRGWERVEHALALGEPPAWEDARAQFRAAAAVSPEFGPAWNNLGIAAARLGRRDEALDSFRHAVRASPRLAAPHVNLSALLLSDGEAEAAVDQLEAAARAEPSDRRIRFLLERARDRLAPGPRPRETAAGAGPMG